MNGIKATGDPVNGVAMFHPPKPQFEPDIQILRVRLPSEMRDLAPVIIDDLLVRERGNAR
jgi:hypothetical protein